MSQILMLVALVPWILVTPPDPSPPVKLGVPRPPTRETVLAPAPVQPDAADDVIDDLDASRRVRCVRIERQRETGADADSRAVRDSAEVSRDWLKRFHRLCRRLPPGDCGVRFLGEGGSDPLGVRVEGLDPGSTPAIELDFEGRCIRFVRQGGIVAMRSMGGREAQLLGLVREAIPNDGVMRTFELANGVKEGRVAPAPPAAGSARTP